MLRQGMGWSLWFSIVSMTVAAISVKRCALSCDCEHVSILPRGDVFQGVDNVNVAADMVVWCHVATVGVFNAVAVVGRCRPVTGRVDLFNAIAGSNIRLNTVLPGMAGFVVDRVRHRPRCA